MAPRLGVAGGRGPLMPSPTCLPAAAAQRGWQARHTGCCRRSGAVLAAVGRQQAPQADPYAVLKVARGSSRLAIRAAYIEQIKLLHPDVSASGEDSTREAAALNAAYEALMAGGRQQAYHAAGFAGRSMCGVWSACRAPHSLPPLHSPKACANTLGDDSEIAAQTSSKSFDTATGRRSTPLPPSSHTCPSSRL